MVAEELPDVSREETLAGILSMFFEALADAILLVIARSYLVFELREKLRSPPGVPINEKSRYNLHCYARSYVHTFRRGLYILRI